MTAASAVMDRDHPRVGVGVLLVDAHNRVLLTLRARPPEAGCWSIVGGKVDFLETLEQCAIREACEEVGLEIRLGRLLCVTDHCLPRKASTGFLPPTSDKSWPAMRATASRTRRAKCAGSR